MVLAINHKLESATTSVEVGRQRRWLMPLLLVAVLGLAALLRLRHLMSVPSFTDETDEVLRGLAIAQGQLRPLVNDDAYIGALFNYAIAGLFLLTGPSPLTPRLLVCAAGLLTVWLTYWLGRELAGRWAGLLASGLLATASLHIIINSRVAWSHSITPLFTTAALLGLLLALRRGSGPLLVLTGLLTGLALQTHPTGVAILPALGLGYLLDRRGRAWLRTPWPYLALAAALLGCANLLVYNLAINPGQAWREAEAYDYAFERKGSLITFGTTFLHYLIELIRALGSIYGPQTRWLIYLTNPAFIIYGLLLLGGLLLSLRQRRWLLPLLFLSASVLLPFFGRQFTFLPSDLARYLGLLLPPGLALIAACVVTGLARLRALAERRLAERAAGWPGLSLQLASIAVCLALLWFPLSATVAFEASFARRLETQAMSALIDAAIANRNGAIYVDERFNRDLLFGGGHLQHSFIYLILLHGADYRTLTLKPGQTGQELAHLLTPGTIIVLRDSSVASIAPLPLEPVYVVTPAMRAGRFGYGAYRVRQGPSR